MTDAITRTNGRDEFAAIEGTDVWHFKGQRLIRGAPLEQWQVDAGTAWTVQRAVVRYCTDRAGTLVSMPDKHVLLRSDTKAPLGIVSDGYEVVQPRQILETLKNEATRAGFELETAGTLHGGRIIFATASDGQQAEVGKGDVILSRTLLKTHTDGSGATEGYETEICVVCANTLRAAMAGNKAKARVTHRSKYNVSDMARKLGLVHDDEFATRVDSYRRLADKSLSAQRAERIVFDLLKPASLGETVVEVEKVTSSLGFRKVMDLFNGAGRGATMDGRKGTAWGLLNAFTEYADHHARAVNDDNRTVSAWFGAGDALKTKAAAYLLAA